MIGRPDAVGDRRSQLAERRGHDPVADHLGQVERALDDGHDLLVTRYPGSDATCDDVIENFGPRVRRTWTAASGTATGDQLLAGCIDDPGARHVKGAPGCDVGFHGASGGCIEHANAGYLVVDGRTHHGLEIAFFHRARGDDQLSAASVGYVVVAAKPVEQRIALDAQPCFERPLGSLVVDARVDHPAGVPGLVRAAEEAGLELIDRTPRTGADGHRVAFIHPRSTSGVLVELVQL